MARYEIAVLALAFCVAGLVFLVLTVRNERRAEALEERGVVAIAEVTSIERDRDTDAGERVVYRLVVDGERYEGSSRHLARADLDVARALHQVEVRYLPDDPSVSAPTRAMTARTQRFAWTVSIGLTVFGLLLALSVWRDHRRYGRFLR
ncbi:MAG: DUF3592 domain-containing protein [Sandaracinus sp.]